MTTEACPHGRTLGDAGVYGGSLRSKVGAARRRRPARSAIWPASGSGFVFSRDKKARGKTCLAVAFSLERCASAIGREGGILVRCWPPAKGNASAHV